MESDVEKKVKRRASTPTQDQGQSQVLRSNLIDSAITIAPGSGVAGVHFVCPSFRSTLTLCGFKDVRNSSQINKQPL